MKARQGSRIGQIFADGRQIDEALRLAARDAIRKHALHDAPVVIWSCPGFVKGELLSRILTAPTPRGIGR